MQEIAKKQGKNKSRDCQQVTNMSLIKNNSPGITLWVPRWELANFPRFMGLYRRLCAAHYQEFQDISARVRQGREPLLWVSYNN